MPSLPDITAKVVADPSGFEAGLDKAKAAATRWSGVLSKLPGADIFQKYKKEIGGIAAGFGAVTVASKALDYGAKAIEDARQKVGKFREVANEANKAATLIGVNSRSLFELQAAGKGTSFEDLTKLIFRYNLAAGDTKKASQFAAVGLRQVAIEGGNAKEVLFNLVRATERMGRGQQAAWLKETFNLKPDQLMAFLPFMEGGAAGFSKRIAQAQSFGLVPSQESLDLAKQAKKFDTIYKQFQEGADRRLGEAMLPADVAWSRAKASYAMARARGYGLPATAEDVKSFQVRMATGGAFAPSPLSLAYDFFRSWSDLGNPEKQKLAIDKAQADLYGVASKAVLGPIQEQIDKATMGAREAHLKSLRADLETQGLEKDRVDLLIQEARRLDELAEKEGKLAAVRESTKQTKAESLTEQVSLLKQVGSAGAIEKLVEMRRQFYGVRDATESYILKLEELQRTHLALGGTEAENDRLRKREQEAYEASFGAGLTPVEQFRRRMEEIKGSLLSDDKKALAAQAALGLLGQQPERQLPAALTRGSAAADAAESRFRAGYDRKPEMTQERIRELLDEANKIQQAQLTEARKTAAAMQQMGLLN